MKVRGQKLAVGLASEMIVFPREGGDIAFRAMAVVDRSEFDQLCEPPKIPKKRIRGGKLVDDFESPRYKIVLFDYNKKYFDWLALSCLFSVNKLGENEPIEWETVDKADATTWHNWMEELKAAGFSEVERGRILNAIMSANSLNEGRLEEARQSFLASTEEAQNQLSSPDTEQSDTPSGEPASV